MSPGREVQQDKPPGPDVAVERVPPKHQQTPVFEPRAIATVEDAVRAGDLASEQLVTSFPGHPDALELRARFEFEFGSPDAAASLWRQILENNPQYTHALAGLGDYQQNRGNLDEAVTFYRRAADTAPDEPARGVKLASCLSEAGRLDEAKETLERVHKAHPQDAEASNELGAVLLQRREYERARSVYQHTIKIDPLNAKAHCGLATASRRLGDQKTAVEHLKIHRKCRHQRRTSLAEQRRNYDDLDAISADIAQLLHNIALVYLSQEHSDAAVLVLEQAAALNDSHLPSRQLLARLAKQEGDLEKALHWQQQVAERSLTDLQATLEQAMLLGAAGRIDEAEQAMESFVEANPDDAQAAMTLAQFYVDVKPEIEKAVVLAQRGSHLSGKVDDYVFLAALQEHAGDREASADTLTAAASLPGFNTNRQHQLLESLRTKFRANSQPND